MESNNKGTNNGIGTRLLPFIGIFIGALVLLESYHIRLLAIRKYGTVIHEFDPYFNFRATEYLYEHGAKKFFTWFDYMVWYPLGRPVGTTIYPGMQFTAVWIKNYIVGDNMSLNDVCCYIPAWFGVIATIITGLITYEISLASNTSRSILSTLSNIFSTDEQEKQLLDSKNERSNSGMLIPVCCALYGMGAMAIIPAHLMRSVGGGFDNESVAMAAMLLTFYSWTRSLREDDEKSYLFGILTGFSYFYMAATWGGYVFVLNMIGMHAGLLVLLGRFSTKVYNAYSLFYVIGTLLAIQVPVVGLAPLKSLEQLGAFLVFIGFQVLQFCEVQVRKKNLKALDVMKFRLQIFVFTALTGIAVLVLFAPSGYFGPISSRVRGLFVKHTKTGNPLVDSVAEHQPAKANSYFQYLRTFCFIAPTGFALVLAHFGDSPSFVAVYGLTAYFFSHKMVRLILFLAPAASILGGVALGRLSAWSLKQFFDVDKDSSNDIAALQEKKGTKGRKKSKTADKNMAASRNKSSTSAPQTDGRTLSLAKRMLAILLTILTLKTWSGFHTYCWGIAHHLSVPTIIQTGQTRNGDTIKVDDYREAYWWIRDNTPQDSRIMAWWDYGYQITAIANRTTVADGNTWNHEHIALLARVLTGPLDEGYDIARHLADYVLVWAGGGGDDVAKSPHLARIANSVYRSMCPDDPVCQSFGFVVRLFFTFFSRYQYIPNMLIEHTGKQETL